MLFSCDWSGAEGGSFSKKLETIKDPSLEATETHMLPDVAAQSLITMGQGIFVLYPLQIHAVF